MLAANSSRSLPTLTPAATPPAANLFAGNSITAEHAAGASAATPAPVLSILSAAAHPVVMQTPAGAPIQAIEASLNPANVAAAQAAAAATTAAAGGATSAAGTEATDSAPASGGGGSYGPDSAPASSGSLPDAPDSQSAMVTAPPMGMTPAPVVWQLKHTLMVGAVVAAAAFAVWWFFFREED
jgi:hypothetical protein